MSDFDNAFKDASASLINAFGEQILIDDTLYEGVYEEYKSDPFDVDNVSEVITISRSNSQEIRQGMAVVVRNNNYIISRVNPDGNDLLQLSLERQ